MTMRIEGIEALTKTLVDISPAEARRIARRTVTSVARLVRDRVRANAPVGKTGNLRKSVKSRRSKGSRDEASAEVWVDQSGGRSGKGYHWHFVEFGTTNMVAQPFVTPTVEAIKPNIPTLYRSRWWPEYRAELVKRAKKQAKRGGRK